MPGRLDSIERRLDALITTLAQHAAGLTDSQQQRLAALPDRLDAVERRIEEIVGYFAHQTAHLAQAQSTYLGDHTALTRLQSGHLIYVDTRSIDIASHVLNIGAWEPGYMALFRRLLRPGNTVLDIGANHGIYSLAAAAAIGPAGRVIGFEPNPRLARLARQSLAVNGFGGFAVIHQLAVGDAPGETRLAFNHEWSGGGHIDLSGQAVTEEQVTCRVVTLDEMFPAPDFRVDVLKMDVEGFEGRAIRGMRGMLARSTHLRMMLEFGPAMLARAGVPATELIGMLQQLGFRFWAIGGDGSMTPEEPASLAAATDGLRNILACRQDMG